MIKKHFNGKITKEVFMKKIAIFFLVIIIIIAGISYMYLNYKTNYYTAKKQNSYFDSYYNQEFYGAEIATIVNKAFDNNLTSKVEKDSKGKCPKTL